MGALVRWGLLGTGEMAAEFARAVAQSRTGRLTAVAARESQRARTRAEEIGVSRWHGSYRALLLDDEVDAVYIATHHPSHAEWAIEAAEAGKHILCEKPLTLNYAEAQAVVEAARRNDVFLMEAYMYRVHPQTSALVRLLQEQTVGAVRALNVTFSFAADTDAPLRLTERELGGGGILDVGGYCTSMASLICQAAIGIDAVEPLEVRGMARIHPGSQVDHYATAILRFPADILAQVACGIGVARQDQIGIYGTDGTIQISQPSWASEIRDGGQSQIVVIRNGETTEIDVEAPLSAYTYEADHVAEHLGTRQSPVMTWRQTLTNMRTLDRWRESVDVNYEQESEGAVSRRIFGRYRTRTVPEIPRARIPGLQPDVSRLVMGADAARTPAAVAVAWDHYVEAGGNCFDAAWMYDLGQAEQRLGWWLESRGIRKDVLILDKGGHHTVSALPLWAYSECTPEALSRQHLESLARLRTDYVDLYMLHRDNPNVPAAEFIDVLNEHLRAGTMRAIGASNWTVARIEEANRYARASGLEGFIAVSNQFSLARMVHPVWPGVVSASDPRSREWFARTQMPLIPWSSQARGFFVDTPGTFVPGDDADREPDDVNRHWTSRENLVRRERATELAQARHVEPVTVALAWVLNQPFPTFPIIGPRTLEHLNSSISALELTLSEDELAWLDLLGDRERLGSTRQHTN